MGSRMPPAAPAATAYFMRSFMARMAAFCTRPWPSADMRYPS